MRRLSVKSKKGKADTSGSENTHQDDVQADNVAESDPDSAIGEGTKDDTKRRNKRSKTKENSVGAEDSHTETKKKKRGLDVDETAEAVEYEVDRVMEVHFKKDGSREFLIHWKGFSHKDDTWEPEKNLNCPDLINKFMEKVDKAKSTDTRELRANPQHTDRFTLNVSQAGRRLSRRNQGKQRATYHSYM